jgi:hypothetical protein
MVLALPLLSLLSGCVPAYLYEMDEVRDDELVSWSGWIFADIPVDGAAVLVDGRITVQAVDGQPLAEGIPSDRNPGYWQVDVPPHEKVRIRIEGPTTQPTLWRAITPGARAYWFAGALFSVSSETLAPFWQQLQQMMDTPPVSEDSMSLYGAPSILDEADEAAWTGADLSLWHENGDIYEVYALATDEASGGLVAATPFTGPISAFAVPAIEPGTVSLVIDASDGRSTVMDWTGAAGDLLSAYYLVLPEPAE